MTCKVCNGSGRMTYPHPDDEGGMTTAVAPCPECGRGAGDMARRGGGSGIGEMMDEMTYYDDAPTGDDEVTALWDGRLPMDRVLRVLQQEIERRKVAEEQRAKIFELLSNGSAELTAALRWRSVALSLGEAWASHGPDNYYDMTPEQWLEWMNEVLDEYAWGCE